MRSEYPGDWFLAPLFEVGNLQNPSKEFKTKVESLHFEHWQDQFFQEILLLLNKLKCLNNPKGNQSKVLAILYEEVSRLIEKCDEYYLSYKKSYYRLMGMAVRMQDSQENCGALLRRSSIFEAMFLQTLQEKAPEVEINQNYKESLEDIFSVIEEIEKQPQMLRSHFLMSEYSKEEAFIGAYERKYLIAKIYLHLMIMEPILFLIEKNNEVAEIHIGFNGSPRPLNIYGFLDQCVIMQSFLFQFPQGNLSQKERECLHYVSEKFRNILERAERYCQNKPLPKLLTHFRSLHIFQSGNLVYEPLDYELSHQINKFEKQNHHFNSLMLKEISAFSKIEEMEEAFRDTLLQYCEFKSWASKTTVPKKEVLVLDLKFQMSIAKSLCVWNIKFPLQAHSELGFTAFMKNIAALEENPNFSDWTSIENSLHLICNWMRLNSLVETTTAEDFVRSSISAIKCFNFFFFKNQEQKAIFTLISFSFLHQILLLSSKIGYFQVSYKKSVGTNELIFYCSTDPNNSPVNSFKFIFEVNPNKYEDVFLREVASFFSRIIGLQNEQVKQNLAENYDALSLLFVRENKVKYAGFLNLCSKFYRDFFSDKKLIFENSEASTKILKDCQPLEPIKKEAESSPIAFIQNDINLELIVDQNFLDSLILIADLEAENQRMNSYLQRRMANCLKGEFDKPEDRFLLEIVMLANKMACIHFIGAATSDTLQTAINNLKEFYEEQIFFLGPNGNSGDCPRGEMLCAYYRELQRFLKIAESGTIKDNHEFLAPCLQELCALLEKVDESQLFLKIQLNLMKAKLVDAPDLENHRILVQNLVFHFQGQVKESAEKHVVIQAIDYIKAEFEKTFGAPIQAEPLIEKKEASPLEPALEHVKKKKKKKKKKKNKGESGKAAENIQAEPSPAAEFERTKPEAPIATIEAETTRAEPRENVGLSGTQEIAEITQENETPIQAPKENSSSLAKAVEPMTAPQAAQSDESEIPEATHAHQKKFSAYNLHRAAKKGLIKTVNLLLNEAERAYANDKEGMHSFFWYCDKNNFSSLNCAARNGHTKTVEALLNFAKKIYRENKEDFQKYIAHEDDYGFSALHTACKQGKLEVVKLLLKHAEESVASVEWLKAFICTADRKGFSPLNSACGHKEIVSLLLNFAKKLAADDKGWLKEFILQANHEKFSPLNNASKKGHCEVVDLLLKFAKGLDPDKKKWFKKFISTRDKDDFSALNSAAFSGRKKVIELLLSYAEEAGRDDKDWFKNFILQRDAFGFSALISASKEGRHEVVELLLGIGLRIFDKNSPEFKAFINVKNLEGYTAINAAARAAKEATRKGDAQKVMHLEAVIRLLKTHGADPRIPNKDFIDAFGNYNKISEIRVGSVSRISEVPKKSLVQEIEETKPGPRGRELEQAASAGDVKTVKLLLEAAQQAYQNDETVLQTFLSYQNNTGSSALNSAARAGKAEIVKLLLNTAQLAGIQNKNWFKDLIGQCNFNDFNALNNACRAKNPEIVALLLKFAWEADSEDKAWFKKFISNRDDVCFSPLNAAVHAGKKETLELLLNYAIEIALNDKAWFKEFINNEDNLGFSPLITACKGHHFSEMRLLLEAIEIVFGSCSEELRDVLTKEDNCGFTSLNSACKEGQNKMVSLLLEFGKKAFADDAWNYKIYINKSTVLGYTPLNSAARILKEFTNKQEDLRLRLIDIIKQLLAAGVNPLIRDQFGKNALYYCPEINECVQGLRILSKDDSIPREFTAKEIKKLSGLDLHNAVLSGDPAKVKLLLKQAETLYAPGDPSWEDFFCYQDGEGCSPLNIAARAGHLKIVPLLLKHAKKNDLEKTCFKCFLRQSNREGFAPLNSAAFAGHVRTVEYLLKYAEIVGKSDKTWLECFINQCNKSGASALNSAVCQTNTRTVELLMVYAGFENFLGNRDNYGVSALHSACERGQLEMLQILIEAAGIAFGKESKNFSDFINVKNGSGETPINLAAKKAPNARQPFEKIIQELLANGADPSIPDRKGAKPSDHYPKIFEAQNGPSVEDLTADLASCAQEELLGFKLGYIPPWVQGICHKIGASTLLTGGAVVSLILGEDPASIKDWDFVVAGKTLDEIAAYLKRYRVRKIDGALHSHLRIQFGELCSVDISIMSASFFADAKRRDFTINACYLDIFKGRLYDPLGALESIKQESFILKHTEWEHEEGNIGRIILRGVKFLVKRPQFEFHPATLKWIEQNGKFLEHRLAKHTLFSLLYSGKPYEILVNLYQLGLLKIMFPDTLNQHMADARFLEHIKQFDQRKCSAIKIKADNGQYKEAVKEISDYFALEVKKFEPKATHLPQNLWSYLNSSSHQKFPGVDLEKIPSTVREIIDAFNGRAKSKNNFKSMAFIRGEALEALSRGEDPESIKTWDLVIRGASLEGLAKFLNLNLYKIENVELVYGVGHFKYQIKFIKEASVVNLSAIAHFSEGSLHELLSSDARTRDFSIQACYLTFYKGRAFFFDPLGALKPLKIKQRTPDGLEKLIGVLSDPSLNPDPSQVSTLFSKAFCKGTAEEAFNMCFLSGVFSKLFPQFSGRVQERIVHEDLRIECRNSDQEYLKNPLLKERPEYIRQAYLLALFFSIRITETKERATLEKLVEKEVSACGFFIRPETQSLIVEIYEMANRI